jgi:hypothetical protein
MKRLWCKLVGHDWMMWSYRPGSTLSGTSVTHRCRRCDLYVNSFVPNLDAEQREVPTRNSVLGTGGPIRRKR